MSIQITRPGKYGLVVDTPVMPAAGTFGFGNVYRNLINFEKLGAIVTNPVTYQPFSPANGPRIVPLDAGVLVHTGLPNLGVTKVLKEYGILWVNLPVPVIVHYVARDADEVRKGIGMLDQHEAVDAIELGLPDDITWEDAEDMVQAASDHAEKPVMVRLPVYDAYEIAQAVADAGADALVVAAPPRGTARDPRTGRMIRGRIYGPLVKPMVLQLVEVLRQRINNVPIIGAGGIHSPQDARDYLEAGAVAVQVDSVTWIQPNMLERIARDLGGGLVTRATDAFADEWHPDMGDTEYKQQHGNDDSARS